MKYGGKVLICLAGGVALSAIARADDVVLPGNPYAPIVARNVFGLNPPTPVDDTVDTTPPPKISLNGIMTIFGKRQALYKVAGVAKPGKPAQDESYILSEGQRQDDVEVTRIDEKKGLVTFNNHGVVQEIPLANGVATTAAAPSAPHLPMMPGGRPPGAGFRGFERFGGRGGNGEEMRNIPTRNDNGQPTSLNSFGQQNNYNSSSRSMLSPDDQQALIAAQKAQLQQEGNPMAQIFPPTKYDADAAAAAQGSTPAPPPAP